MTSGLHLYSRLLRYVRPYWWAFALAVLGMVVVAAGDMIMTYMVIPIVQSFQNPDPAKTKWLPLAIVGVFVLRGIGSFVSDYGMAYTGFRVVFDLRRALVDKLLKLPTPYYDVTPGGVVQSKLTFDAHQLASAASGTITTAIRSTMTILASFGLLLYFNWRLTLWTFVILPVVAVVIRYFSRRLRRIARDVQTRTASMTHVLEEMIGGHRIVRIFGGEAYERERAVKAANALRNSMSKQSSASAASSPITQILAVLAVAVIIWIAMGQSQDGKLDLPIFLSYTVALLTLLERLKALSGINASIQRGLAAAESIFGMLDREDEPDNGTVDARARARRIALRSRLAAVRRQRTRCADRRLADDPAGRDGRAGRQLGQRQDVARQPDSALLRAVGRPPLRRRPRHHDADAREPARADRAGVAGRAAVRRHHRRQHRLRRDGRHVARGHRTRRGRRARARIHPRDAAGLRHARRRERHAPVRRPAAADRDRARHPQGRADPDPRRGDVVARLRIRAAGAGRARRADAGPHDDRHRAPAVDDRARRPHRRARRRPHRRAGHARRADRARRRLRAPPPAPVRGHRAVRRPPSRRAIVHSEARSESRAAPARHRPHRIVGRLGRPGDPHPDRGGGHAGARASRRRARRARFAHRRRGAALRRAGGRAADRPQAPGRRRGDAARAARGAVRHRQHAQFDRHLARRRGVARSAAARGPCSCARATFPSRCPTTPRRAGSTARRRPGSSRPAKRCAQR